MDNSWKLKMGEFMDAARRDIRSLEQEPVFTRGDERLRALAACVAEALSAEQGAESAPEWAAAVPPLTRPWFVAGMESLKAMALVESPVYFRRRNIFVLGNFLSRA